MKHQALIDALKALPMNERIEVAEAADLVLECCTGCGCYIGDATCEHDEQGPGSHCACSGNPENLCAYCNHPIEPDEREDDNLCGECRLQDAEGDEVLMDDEAVAVEVPDPKEPIPLRPRR